MVNVTDSLLTLMGVGSVEARSGSIIVCPKICRREILDVSELVRNFKNQYAINEAVVAFVCENRVFVCPKMKSVLNTLHEAGLKEAKFYVPYSENGEYPLEQEKRWRSLLEEQARVLEMEFISECEEYSDDNHIGRLSDEIFKDCLEVPKEGIPISFEIDGKTHLNYVMGLMGVLSGEPHMKRMQSYKSIYYPEIKIGGQHFNNRVAQKLGTYCTNNGKIVFVYRNGKTYVSKFYEVEKALQQAGYIKVNMLVPLSSGEVITDPELKAKWDSLDRW